MTLFQLNHFLLTKDLPLFIIKYPFLLLIILQLFSFPQVLLKFHSLLFLLLPSILNLHFNPIQQMILFDLLNQMQNQPFVFLFIRLIYPLIFLQLSLNFLLSTFLLKLLLKLCVISFLIFLGFIITLQLVLLFMNVNSAILNILLSFNNFY